MDPEKSSNSSFEDLSNLSETGVKSTTTTSTAETTTTSMAETSTTSMAETITTSMAETTTSSMEETTTASMEDTTTTSMADTTTTSMADTTTTSTADTTTTSTADTTTTEENKSQESDDCENDVIDLIGNQQIIKKIIVKGHSSVRPKQKDFVTINYTGKLEDGKIVQKEENFEMHVGDFEIVQGLDMAIPLMYVGEIAEVNLEPRFAYGSLGLKNENDPEKSIPPNAKMIYSIALLKCVPEDEDEFDTFAARKLFGNRKRERANFWYNRNEFNIAIQIYRRALEYFEYDYPKDDEVDKSDLQNFLEERVVVYNNLAMAQIKISAYDSALGCVENVLRCQPNNSKALFRKGRILDVKGDTKGAIALLRKAAILEPDSKSIQQDLAKLILKNRREERNEKEMYQKMLGQTKNLEENNRLNNEENNVNMSRFKCLGFIIGSILIGVAGVAYYRYKY